MVVWLFTRRQSQQSTEVTKGKIFEESCRNTSDTIICTDLISVVDGLKYQTQLPGIIYNLQIDCVLLPIIDPTHQCVMLKNSVFSDRNRLLHSLVITDCCVRLTSNTFKGFNQLEKLYLSGGLLDASDLAAFQYHWLPKLTDLSLAKNNISNAGLENDTFFGLPSLLNLDLSLNKIKQFTPVLKQSLSQLTLRQNSLNTAILSRGKLIKVCQLDYSDNQIQHIQASSFQNIVCDKELTLIFSGNSFLSVIGNDIFAKFKAIGTLSFKDIALNFRYPNSSSSLCNLLHALQNKKVGVLELIDSSLTDQDIAGENTCFQSLAKVKLNSLNISWNLIELRGKYLNSFFTIMAKIVSLEKLDLSGNDIISGVAITVTLTNLKFLDLSKNYIPRISNALSFVGGYTNGTVPRTVPRLETLRLRRAFDKTSSLTRGLINWFIGLETLKTLDLSDNDLFKEMSFHQYQSFYDGVPNLNYMNLADTDLGLLNASWSIRYPSYTLTQLYISNSYFTDLHMPLLERLRSLNILDLTSNRLGRLIPIWFRQLGNLTKLLVSDNKIAYVDVRTFDNLSNLKKLTLGNNAFGCECSSRQLAQWLYGHLPKHQDITTNYYGNNLVSFHFPFDQTREIRRRYIEIDFDQIICLEPVYGQNLTLYDPLRLTCDVGLAVVVGVGTFGAVIAFIGVVLCFVYRTDIHYRTATNYMAFYTKRLTMKIKREGSKEQLLYYIIDSDAFVCYDVSVGVQHHWIKCLDNMLHFCNSMRVRLKYLLLPRDNFHSQVLEVAPTCRSILLVVDQGFMDNVWVNIEPALLSLPKDRIRHCVLVLLDDIRLSDLDESLRSLARKGSFYKWPLEGERGCCGGLKNKRSRFWKELRMALRGFPKHTVPLLFKLLGLWCCRRKTE
jgi:Leucine-rich repeat (LRR) protein